MEIKLLRVKNMTKTPYFKGFFFDFFKIKKESINSNRIKT